MCFRLSGSLAGDDELTSAGSVFRVEPGHYDDVTVCFLVPQFMNHTKPEMEKFSLGYFIPISLSISLFSFLFSK